jgi:hypothetical protein
MTPREFFDILIAKGLYEDAREFLVYGLGSRQRMIWTSLCLSKLRDICKLPSGEFAAMRAAMQWALLDSDENRRQAGQCYEAIGATTPAGNIALAVFASSGSLAPPGLPAVPPPPAMMPRALLSAQRLILNGFPLEKRPRQLHTFLVLGCQFGLLTRPLNPNAAPPEGRGRHAVYDHLRGLLRRLLIELDLLPESPPVDHEEAWEKEVWEDLDG